MKSDSTALTSQDSVAFTLIGKVGMGDIDISEDGNTLYFVNLFQKKVHTLDITQFNADGTSIPTVTSEIVLPDPGCTNGVARPWALKVFKGLLYAGMVCDASLSYDNSDLRAYLYSYDGTAWTSVFDFPLNYPKGHIGPTQSLYGSFQPWTDRIHNMSPSLEAARNDGVTIDYPSPIFMDIEFDLDASLVLGFGDRTGLQLGNANLSPNAVDRVANGNLVGNQAGGNILRAYFNGSTYLLESNGIVNGNAGAGVGNNQGPGFGEFYNDILQSARSVFQNHAECTWRTGDFARLG